jgi:preprotein translocase subunit SecA
MFNKIFGSLFGTRHERERKRVQPIIDDIVSIEQRLATLTDAEIQAQTAKFRGILAERTGAIEARIAELKTAKRTAADAAERERIDNELGSTDAVVPRASCARPSPRCSMNCSRKPLPRCARPVVA